jgi:hypothetical protein
VQFQRHRYNRTSTAQDYVESSGNVFADIGLESADELLNRAQLGYSVQQVLKKRAIKQRKSADLFVALMILGSQNPPEWGAGGAECKAVCDFSDILLD